MKKILIVEDDKDISRALEVRLKSEGFEVVVAPDAVYGTMKAVSESPDLIILDISMPGGNGFDIAERIKMNPEVPDIPIIFITAHHEPDLAEKARQLNAAGFFQKPYDSKQLMRSIHLAV